MSIIMTFILSLLALIGIHAIPITTPEPTSGSIRVIARACPTGVTAVDASSSVCSVWVDGAAIQVTDLMGNAWGMNASRDNTAPHSPVIYSLDGMAFGTYRLGQPTVPPGFTAFFIAGAELTSSGDPQIDLNPDNARGEITVYFLK